MLTSLLDGQVIAQRYGLGLPSVVALHGWGRSAQDWAEVLRSSDALALDLPGFGNSPLPSHVMGSPEYADLVLRALRNVTKTPFTLVGHSFGGRVAAQIAAREPDLIAGLVLTGVPLFRPTVRAKPPLALRSAKTLNRLNLLPTGTVERLRNRYGSADYRATSGVMRGTFVRLVNEDYEAVVSAIATSEIPVSLVWGEYDQEVPVSVGARIKERIGRSDFRVVSGAGHFLDWSISKELRFAINDLSTTHH